MAAANNKYKTNIVWATLLAGLLTASCGRVGVYEKNAVIPGGKWSYSLKHSFSFQISDTAAQYLIMASLRHTDAYRYNNIWLNIGFQAPGDTMQTKRIEISLGNDQKGWEGTGMDDTWDVIKPISPGPVRFRKPGTYTFTLEQIMRDNPLTGILNAGIRIEKVH